MHQPSQLVGVQEAGQSLGVSVSTVWRMIRSGTLPSVRQGGRRLVPRDALESRVLRRQAEQVPPLRKDHPIFRLIGAGRSGGQEPGARDKHVILDR
ncbi:MAG: helix-turn-helix domain-containing protein [Gammaproteobacteria bacterium]